MDGKISLCVNTDILEEYEEILSHKTTPAIAHNVVEAIANLSTTIMQNTYLHFEIVTNDKHFNPLKAIPWPKVEIIKIDDFIKQL